MLFAVCFTNFGPYHLARLRALAALLAGRGDRLIAYETAGDERTYPWERRTEAEAFDRVVLFPNRTLEEIPAGACAEAMTEALDRDRPDALGVVGYARPESMAMARWTRRNSRSSILMSESQSVDRPRVWYKEMIKSRRMNLFDAALVGGPYHRDYLVDLGMPADRVAFGYNAVDNAFYEARADQWRNQPEARAGLPAAPYFLTVCRFAPEKNLIRLIEAFALYRGQAEPGKAWDLVVCGGGPQADEVEKAVERSGCGSAIHRPGFLQADALSRWYAFAGGFVLASVSEPWGLVANEAAAAGLPLLLSSRAGCARTLVPDPEGITGARFDPFDASRMAAKLSWLAERPEAERLAIGRSAREVVSAWGPERFAQGAVEAWEIARRSPRRRASLLRKGS
ncbi:glycosyltransferase [Paludisphaera borealis]|uniref:GT4 family glycosyltransferase n=1 Tax=Paludisphaera borealis TaxID=1387353 RepID=A0A1U7CRW3_9BACT|nr:glycosyltransferase [Paludisphaera borealis]APW61672.1 GT4 family glycosyltransferase [Paludisphaera borealis]